MRKAKIVRLSVVRNQRKADEAKFMRSDMFRCARNITSAFGDEFSGWAFIAWDRKGDIRTALNHGYGPLAWASLPEHARDALQRHIGIELAQTRTFDEPLDDDSA